MKLRHDALKLDYLLRLTNGYQGLAIAATNKAAGSLPSTYEFANLARSASP